MTDDLKGLYLNGQLIEQGRHVRLKDVVQIHPPFKFVTPDREWLEWRVVLPENLSKVNK